MHVRSQHCLHEQSSPVASPTLTRFVGDCKELLESFQAMERRSVAVVTREGGDRMRHWSGICAATRTLFGRPATHCPIVVLTTVHVRTAGLRLTAPDETRVRAGCQVTAPLGGPPLFLDGRVEHACCQASGIRMPLSNSNVLRIPLGGRTGCGAGWCIAKRDCTICGSQSALPTNSTSTSGSNGLRR
jgi:hypothetical protein